MKRFKDLQAGDSLYFVDCDTTKIKLLQIAVCSPIDDDDQGRYMVTLTNGKFVTAKPNQMYVAELNGVFIRQCDAERFIAVRLKKEIKKMEKEQQRLAHDINKKKDLLYKYMEKHNLFTK